MSDAVSPFTISPLPSPSSSKSNKPMLYYGLVVVGTAAIVLAIYNVIILKRCSRRRMQSQPTRPVTVSSRSFENYSSNRNLLSSFKYKKEAEGGGEGKEPQAGGGGGDYECPVCLSLFEEGEEVRKLPRCKHFFHAICIDMWLHSHFDCPVCRTPVGPFPYYRFPADINTPPENSRDGLLEAGISVGRVRGS